ncbi:DUF86 domain-containing protein [Patescibacteria group bacterium]|nr:DUF86 domain-containing protein [Candidatus Falkowbacteria bacterium]MBU3906353.1 DUF86 domain-containing protein [Patescibacteria group bacterium]MCG2698120.1 DUF86 domain-containing protein [Candidatus Parcubacteria bacterium]MBU4026724.1 DUF86 domain-containing protein [Patescibacteria group bacterium]MBU4072537.1 DUF86 domain-containing protein [Patescibacteria group bacterium]
MKDDMIYLKHILESIEQIENYLHDVDYEAFTENDMMVNATVRMLEIIGEATNNLGKDFQYGHPEIDFRDIIDMRNFLIHEYFGVNKKIVWDTCKTDLPDLKKSILYILQKNK